MSTLSCSLLVLTILGLAACGGGGGSHSTAEGPPVAVAPPAAPAPPAPASSVVELEISGIGRGTVTSSMAWPGAQSARKGVLQLRAQALSNLAQGLDFRLQSAGVVDVGTRGSGGMRYITATYEIRNAQFCATAGSCTAYTAARKNLTFLGVITPTSINNTAISNFVRFDNSAASPALAVQLLPTHGMDSTGTAVLPESASLQVYRETELPAADPSVTSVLPWGFVVRNVNDGGRTLPASPASGRFDGRITFAFKLPLQAVATDDAFKISMRFQVMEDTATRVTLSADEAGMAGDIAVNRRAAEAGATDTVVPCNRLARVLSGYPVCSVRVAGLPEDPTALLWTGGFGSQRPFLSLPIQVNNAPLDTTVTVGTIIAMNAPTAATLVVHGSQSGTRTLTGAYGGVVEGGVAFGRPNQLIFRQRAGDRPFLRNETITFTATAGNRDIDGDGWGAVVNQFTTVGSVPGSRGVFESGPAYVAPPGATDQAVGDVTGDGQLDIVVVDPELDRVRVISGSTATDYPAGILEPRVVALGDMNGDGRLDILMADGGTSIAVLLRNAANNGFEAAQLYSVGQQPAVSLAIGDLNGDGRQDIAAAVAGSNNVAVLMRNRNNTGFDAAVTYAAGTTPSDVALADLDRDGFLDMLVVNAGTTSIPSSSNVMVFSNVGSGGEGTFRLPGTANTYQVFAARPTALKVRDINGDGLPDVVVAYSGTRLLTALSGTESGGFGSFSSRVDISLSSVATSLDVGDIDGDGVPDLAVTVRDEASVYVLRGNGEGGFATPVSYGGLPTGHRLLGGVVLADINADGRLDILALKRRNTVDVSSGLFDTDVASWLGR